MSDIFKGTGVKRYALRRQETYCSPWEYPSALEFDTAEEARAALSGLDTPGKYELVKKYPVLRYAPGAVAESPILANLLDAMGFAPYMLQSGDDLTGWENCYDLQFATLEEARRAAGSSYRVASAAIGFQYEPAEVGG